MVAALFGQTFDAHDLAIIGLLVVLEGVLSIDNALVLGLLAKRLHRDQRSKALTYGLVGAFLFRIIAIATASLLLKWRIVKFLGGAYLVYVAIKHFFFETSADDDAPQGPDKSGATIDIAPGRHAKFWPTVLVIELTDIAFAVDSILAAIALVDPTPNKASVDAFHPKLWVIVTGGMLGVVLMRFAAMLFIRLLERFPRFELSAYLLVIVIGLKLLADWYYNKVPDPKPAGWHEPLDFHSYQSWAFWVFWVLMVGCFCLGFWRREPRPRATAG